MEKTATAAVEANAVEEAAAAAEAGVVEEAAATSAEAKVMEEAADAAAGADVMKELMVELKAVDPAVFAWKTAKHEEEEQEQEGARVGLLWTAQQQEMQL